MTSTRERVAARLREALPGARVEVRDMTGTDDHLEAHVEWDAFAGRSPIERHRIVYAPLKDWIEDDTIHALSIKTALPRPPMEGSP